MAFPLYKDADQFTPTDRPFVVDLDSVRQSITNILATQKGERIFNPGFGIDLENFLFEPMSDETVFGILDEIVTVVGRFEPRVRIDSSKSVVVPDYENSKYDFTIVFYVVGLERAYYYSGILKSLADSSISILQ